MVELIAVALWIMITKSFLSEEECCVTFLYIRAQNEYTLNKNAIGRPCYVVNRTTPSLIFHSVTPASDLGRVPKVTV